MVLVVALVGVLALGACGSPEDRTASVPSSDAAAAQVPPTTLVRPDVAGPPAADAAWTVVRVVDGDTLEVTRDGRSEKVRLLGIDTPETSDPRRPVACFGAEATARAVELADGADVVVSADPGREERDDFGRLLGWVWLPDGRLLNLVMVEEGYAHEVIYGAPTTRQDELAAAEATAREEQRGLWAPDTCAGAVDLPVGESPGSTVAPVAGDCSPEYLGACVPPGPPDVDCSDLAERRFASVGSDPHGLDGNGDGVACE